MKAAKKTLRGRRQRRQRSRRQRHGRSRKIRRHRGGSLPVPSGSLVAVSTQGEYGVPVLISKKQFEEEQERGGLEA